jgi:hypothetical protein
MISLKFMKFILLAPRNKYLLIAEEKDGRPFGYCY